MTGVKLIFKDTTKKGNLKVPTFDALTILAVSMFPELNGRKLEFSYDDEGDIISVSEDSDVETMVECSGSSIKIKVEAFEKLQNLPNANPGEELAPQAVPKDKKAGEPAIEEPGRKEELSEAQKDSECIGYPELDIDNSVDILPEKKEEPAGEKEKKPNGLGLDDDTSSSCYPVLDERKDSMEDYAAILKGCNRSTSECSSEPKNEDEKEKEEIPEPKKEEKNSQEEPEESSEAAKLEDSIDSEREMPQVNGRNEKSVPEEEPKNESPDHLNQENKVKDIYNREEVQDPKEDEFKAREELEKSERDLAKNAEKEATISEAIAAKIELDECIFSEEMPEGKETELARKLILPRRKGEEPDEDYIQMLKEVVDDSRLFANLPHVRRVYLRVKKEFFGLSLNEEIDTSKDFDPVSYTHLTLPTTSRV